MGLLDNILGGGTNAGNNAYSVPIPFIPQNLQQMMQMPYAAMNNEFEVAALTVAVLCNYCQNPQATIEMLNYLRGPRPLSTMEIQFLRDRLSGKGYKPASFFAGATVENGYTPSVPYTITVEDNPYSYPDANFATMWVRSAGADSPRSIRLRKKPSTGQWFLVEIQCLSDIRIPAAEDPWA